MRARAGDLRLSPRCSAAGAVWPPMLPQGRCSFWPPHTYAADQRQLKSFPPHRCAAALSERPWSEVRSQRPGRPSSVFFIQRTRTMILASQENDVTIDLIAATVISVLIALIF